ncbi:MAG: hypothetical protein BMS9Abin10_0854 [Gammaproteobacteria bacterium]|nr:MAG: hypothetical protein BMS9Abin10_0854 [Gammaproteobacteria bacterium]
MSPKEPIDRTLTEYLKNGSVLSRAYKEAAVEEPSPALDAAVLQNARRAGAEHTRAGRGPFARSWLVPASLAAVLLLAVGLVTFVSREGADKLSPESVPRGKLEAIEAQPAAAGAPADEGAALERAAPAPPLAEEPTLMKQQKTPAEKKAAPAPAAAKMRKDAPASVMPAMVPADSAQRPPAQDEAAGQRKKDQREQAPAASPTATEMRELTPEEWLTRIVRLRRQGRADEAEASLAAFKQRYPDYPIEKILE